MRSYSLLSSLLAFAVTAPCLAAQDPKYCPYDAFSSIKRSLPAVTYSEPVLLVVHASTEFDRKERAKPGIDAIVKQFSDEARPIVALTEDDGRSWYADRSGNPNVLYSYNGSHNVSAPEVTLVGGYWGRCAEFALYDLLSQATGETTIHLPLFAIYQPTSRKFHGKLLDREIPVKARNDLEYVKEKLLDPENSVVLAAADDRMSRYEVYYDGKLLKEFNRDVHESAKLRLAQGDKTVDPREVRVIRVNYWSSQETYGNRPRPQK